MLAATVAGAQGGIRDRPAGGRFAGAAGMDGDFCRLSVSEFLKALISGCPDRGTRLALACFQNEEGAQ